MTRDASKYVGRKADNLLIAFVWMMLSALGFSLMMLFVKELSPEVPQFEMVFFRSFVNCVVAAGLMLLSGESFFPPNKPLLVFRGIAGFGGVTCFFYAISRLPMSIAALLNWISPIFVILFSRLFLGERFSSRAWVWIVTAFIGLVLLLRVDLTSGAVALPLVPVMIGLLGSAFAGLAYVAVRAATATVGVNAIIFYFTATASLISAPLAFRQYSVLNVHQFSQLIIMGIFASIGQFAMTQAYRYAAAGLVSTMSLMNAVFSASLGWLLLGEVLVPIQWAGMVLVGASVALIALKGQGRLGSEHAVRDPKVVHPASK